MARPAQSGPAVRRDSFDPHRQDDRCGEISSFRRARLDRQQPSWDARSSAGLEGRFGRCVARKALGRRWPVFSHPVKYVPVLMSEPRVTTGISGLDNVLAGGLPARRLYLVQGDPGVGKTTIGLQFLLEGERRGE